MTGDIMKLALTRPFIPLTIHLADGRSLSAPTVDHIAVATAGGQVVVFGDNDNYDVLSSLVITWAAVVRESAALS